jgi:hypothetical protein
MLITLVELSLRYKVLVLVAFAAVIVFGVRAYREVPVDAFPDVTPTQVNIYNRVGGPCGRGCRDAAYRAGRDCHGRPARCRADPLDVALWALLRQRVF